RDQGLPTQASRANEDAADHRVVVDPATARLCGSGYTAVSDAPLIRVAVIGAGHWGPNLIRNFHNKLQSQVAWVIDAAAPRLAEVQARFPDVRTASDAARALDDASITAVVVATPTTTHYALAKAALERGKHVLVEKPIAASAAQAAELCALAQSV